MTLKRAKGPAGSLLELEHDSRVLAGNPWGDPTRRKIHVWLPAQYDQGTSRGRGRRFPVLFDLVGYTGSGMSHTSWRSFEDNVPELAARLVYQRKMGPTILVFPDCFTALGGNQYVNSSAVGAYADYLVRELVPFVDRELRTLASRDHRGCFGKSSGGYGAMLHGMRHARTWGAIANHSGDAYFEFVYGGDWPNTLDELAKYRVAKRRGGPVDVRSEERGADQGLDDGRVLRFLEHIWRRNRPTEAEINCLMNLCMAATYDADPKAPNGFRLPYNLETGELLAERWRQWRRHDPVHLVGRYARSLASLHGIWIDCGWRDQYRIHYGARQLSKRLAEHGVAHVYEEFDDTHSGIDYRMERSLPFLYRALQP